MAARTFQFTSESVAAGHPDKVADRISDEIVDALLTVEPMARAAVEVLVTRGLCVVAGEIAGAKVDAEGIARRVIGELGFRGGDFAPDRVEIKTHLQAQSAEIANAVGDEGAGDQGIMFGFACRETPELMPAAILYAHRLIEAATSRTGLRLGPDGKSQVTLDYVDGIPVRASTIVLSVQHEPGLGNDELEDALVPIIRETLPTGWVGDSTRLLINPSGSFVVGGPATDTGLTGRKIIVDTYGGAAPHGGGAFSGKDPTKVDRSGAYAARWLAKNVVAAGLAERCSLQLAYAIGVAEPVALYLDTGGTARVPEAHIVAALRSLGSLSQRAIRQRLALDRPIYAATSSYGHFGRAPTEQGHFSWERTDLVEPLLEWLSSSS